MADPAARRPAGRLLPWARWLLFGLMLLAFIVVPFLVLEGWMNERVQHTLQAAGRSPLWVALAVAGFLLLDIVLPVPSSVVLAAAGYLLGWAGGAAACFFGLSCASVAGYLIGWRAGEPLARRVVGDEQLARLTAYSRRHGELLLVASRGTPVLAEAVALLAGVGRMPWPRYGLAASVGNAVVALVYGWIGAHAASESSFAFAAAASVALPLALMLAMRRVTRGAGGG